MLFVLHGNDVIALRKAAHDLVPEGEGVMMLDAEKYQKGMIAEAAGGASLFGGEFVYFLDTPSLDHEFFSEVKDNLELLAASPHRFIVIENKLLAAEKKTYAQYAEEIFEYSRTEERAFNIFALADALLRKDKKSLWLLLHDALQAGCRGEEIVGTLWWQLKILRLAEHTTNAREAGVKDFPYGKAKRALSAFKAGEIEKLSRTLLTLYHDARIGKGELEVALEKWVLTI